MAGQEFSSLMRVCLVLLVSVFLILPCLAESKPPEEMTETLRQGKVFYDLSESGAPLVVFEPGTPEGIGDALQFVLKSGRLDPGVYYYAKPSGAFDHSPLVDSLYKMADFKVTEEHLALLRHLSVRSVDSAPETGELLILFDSKRPYGDLTYYQAEMARHLGLPTSVNERGEVVVSRDVEERMTKLHGEMQVALAIFLMEYTF